MSQLPAGVLPADVPAGLPTALSGSWTWSATGWSWAGALAVALGLLGLSLVWAGLPFRRRPGLDARLAPYLRDTPRPSGLLDDPNLYGGGARLGPVLRPFVRSLAAQVERVLGGAGSVRSRLLRSGVSGDIEGFRVEQVFWGAGCGALGLLLSTAVWLRRGTSLTALVLLVLVCVAAGVIARDQLLSQAVKRRENRILAEFPTVAELLALAVTAGEGTSAALERVARVSRGELSGELHACMADVRAGANLSTALQGLADRTGLASLARFVDGIIVAVDRGTPMAEVLRAQAQDAREVGRQVVIESAGKREIAMMVPVVFLVLPVTVLFAVFPGLEVLRLTI